MRIVAAGTFLIGLGTAGPLLAQVAEAPPDEQVIVVTAQLRPQAPIEVPIALTAYSGDTLAELGIRDLEDLSQFVPGFEVQNQSPNNPGFVIRGITSDTGEAFNEPRVSVFQDGVSISKSRGSYVELFDLERVEVAKGPQSTLYGRGALIGAVNLIQNKARLRRTEGYASLSYGNYDAWVAEGMANLPLGDRAALRVSGRIRDRDGYVENLLGGPDFAGIETWAVRGAARIDAGERVRIDVIGNYQDDETSGTPFKSIGFTPTDPITGVVIGDRRRTSGAALATGPGFEGDRGIGMDRHVWGVTGLIEAELGERLTLNAITAYRRFHAEERFDGDGLSLPILTAAEDARGDQTSQELRLTYEGERVTAFIGGSYFEEDGSQRTPAQFDERILLARFAGALSGPIPGRPATDPAPLAVFDNTAFTSALLQGVAAASGVALPAAQAAAIAANLKPAHGETAINRSRLRSFDIFGDVTLRPSERFEIGAGIRYTSDDKSSAFTASVLNGRSILGGFLAALSQPEPLRSALLGGLSLPGAATIPPSAAFPLPLFGLSVQPTANNGDEDSADLDDSGLTYRLFARFAPSDTTSLYANYARGRRPELLSALTPAAPFGPARFDVLAAETVDSFELGAKGTLADRKLFVDGALFYYRYGNFQTTVQQGVLFVSTNAGKAEAYGFEGQFRWTASRNLRLFGTYAYNHSRFKAGIRDGNRFRLSPDHSLSLGATLSAAVGKGAIDFTPTLTYQSRIFFDDDNDRPDLQVPPLKLVPDLVRDETQKGYALVNARLGYSFGEDRFRIEAYVENLFDTHYVKDAGNTGDAIGLPTFIAAEPRFYGLTASARF